MLPAADGLSDPVRLDAHHSETAILIDIRGRVSIRSICQRKYADAQQETYFVAYADVLRMQVERFRQMANEQLELWCGRCIDVEGPVS